MGFGHATVIALRRLTIMLPSQLSESGIIPEEIPSPSTGSLKPAFEVGVQWNWTRSSVRIICGQKSELNGVTTFIPTPVSNEETTRNCQTKYLE